MQPLGIEQVRRRDAPASEIMPGILLYFSRSRTAELCTRAMRVAKWNGDAGDGDAGAAPFASVVGRGRGREAMPVSRVRAVSMESAAG